MSQYVCLCNISLMLLLWIVLQNAYLEQKKKVISVSSTIYCICMLCYACHTRLIYNKLRKVCFWQCFKFLLFAFCHRSLAESSFIIIHLALTLEKIVGFILLETWYNNKQINLALRIPNSGTPFILGICTTILTWSYVWTFHKTPKGSQGGFLFIWY